jgi:AsmA protein
MLKPMNRRLLIGLAAVLAVLAAAVVAAIHLIVPTQALHDEIERRVTAATGRPFHIRGALAFSLYPAVGLTAHDVTLDNAPGGTAKALAVIDTMQIGAKLIPLFSGRIEATTIELDHPRIALEVAADGRANWKLASTDAGVSLLAKTTFAGVTVKDGAITYDNAHLHAHYAVSGTDLKIALARFDAPTGFFGALTYRGRRLSVSGTLATPASLLAARGTDASLAATAPFLSAGFIGQVSRDATLTGAGRLHTPSLKDLAAWLGHPIAAGTGLGALDAQSQIVAKEQHLTLISLKATLDGMHIVGSLDADVGGRVPKVDGVLTTDRLDLNTYMKLDSGGIPAVGTGWSRAPIKLDLVNALNGHLKLNAGALNVLHMKLGKTGIDLVLNNGAMTAQLSPMQLYGGSGNATLDLDIRGAVPVMANKLVFSNIDMHAFLIDTIGVDKVVGRGTIALDVVSKGASPDAIMRALSGRGSVQMGRGAIHGVDLGRVARTVQTILSAGATGDSATTGFDRFGGSFAIGGGVLANNDLKLSSAFTNMTGRGKLDLGNQTIVYRIEPKATIGGKLALIDVGVPFAITGSWRHLTYTPDLAGAVTGFVGGVFAKGTGLIGGLTGLAPPDKKKKSGGVGDTLKTMFGFH